MVNTLIRWRKAEWTRVHPGRVGLLIALFAPVLLLIPFQRLGLFSTPLQALTVVAWVGTFIWAGIIGRDSGKIRPSYIWPFQKGTSISDFALVGWLLDAALGLAMVLWWAVAWIGFNSIGAREPTIYLVSTGVSMLLIFVIAHSFLFLVAAAGSSRGVDLLAMFAFVSLLQPLLLRALAPVPGRIVDWIVPPFYDAIVVGRAIVTADPTGSIGPLTQVVAFCMFCLIASIALLQRWRPA